MKVNEIDLIFPKTAPAADDPHWAAEWLATNGLGGYSSGTVVGLNTRAYHGYLIAALPAPLGRTLMLNEIYEEVELPDCRLVPLNPSKNLEGGESPELIPEVEFFLELGLPVWKYKTDRFTLERRIWMIHSQNTVYVSYKLTTAKEPVRLRLRPGLNVRSHEAPVDTPLAEGYSLTVTDNQYEVSAGQKYPPLRLCVNAHNEEFRIARRRVERIVYQTEANRGYAAMGELWIPGAFSADLTENSSITLVASTECWDAINALAPADALEAEHLRRRRLLAIADGRSAGQFGQQLVFAADQFLIRPEGRIEDATRAKAAGDEIRTVIAGYHWFTDWGRDTMISLEGLTLTTGRKGEASYILRTFAHAIRYGLLPNLFPEGSRGGLYHTADATLWFFHALNRYLQTTGDNETLQVIMPHLFDIMRCHEQGTRFGIGVDPTDGLLKQGEEGYQLTWMDAKVDGWVVTPRRGKAVEINALWYNALRLMERWCAECRQPEQRRHFSELADRTRESFNQRFWSESEGYLYDVIDGETEKYDASFRPNQIFSISLEHPALREDRWKTVVTQVKEKLLTPVGLRSLAPGSKDYHPRYYGDLRSRDAAYHQGTVWGWLIGPFIDAWLKVYPDDLATANSFLTGFQDHLSQACIGSISEVFDAESPYTPRGCVAQAWSVAEVLRCLVKTTPQ